MKKIFKVVGDLNTHTSPKYDITILEFKVVKETPQSIVVLDPVGEETRFFKTKMFTLQIENRFVSNIHISIFSREEDLESTINKIKQEIQKSLASHQNHIQQMIELEHNGPKIQTRKMYYDEK